MSWGMRLPSRLLMTCLESVVSFAEINQWPLDVITRIHVDVRDRKTHIHEDTKRENKKDWQTNKSIGMCLTLSRSFRSMLITRPWALKPSILSAQKGGKVRLPCSKHDNFIASVFLTFQLSKGTICAMPHRVLTVFSQYKLAFVQMLA